MNGSTAIAYHPQPCISGPCPSVAGFTARTGTSWPGRKAAVVQLSGCNLRCPYCHCPELLHASRTRIPLTGVIARIDAERSSIGGVVITGGEPTADPNLFALVRELSSLAIPLRLDTNGTVPTALEALLDAGLLEFVAVDIKTTPARYDAVTGGHGVWERVRRSIDLVLASGVDHEFRTTCYPSALQSAELPHIAREVEGGRRYAIQQFRPQRTLDPAASSVRPFPAEVLRKAALCCAVHVPTVVRGV